VYLEAYGIVVDIVTHEVIDNLEGTVHFIVQIESASNLGDILFNPVAHSVGIRDRITGQRVRFLVQNAILGTVNCWINS
jgi:hypothetical protein